MLLMLSLTMMASAIIIVVNNHSDLSLSVTQKPIAMKSADTCIDQAIIWLLTPAGTTWSASGVGAETDIAKSGGVLFGKTLTDDTKRSTTDSRTDKFKARTGKAKCTSVVLSVLAEDSAASGGGTGVGSEAGSEAAYDADAATTSPTYVIKVIAEGIFNTETLLKTDGKVEIDKTNWESGSSRGKVEVVLQYQT
tara:strand:- start:798 stop:1379 length:582 start_codon:yes stop_codon:yes gene_type:complete